MVLDIIILAIIVLSIVFGYRAGFVVTLANEFYRESPDSSLRLRDRL